MIKNIDFKNVLQSVVMHFAKSQMRGATKTAKGLLFILYCTCTAHAKYICTPVHRTLNGLSRQFRQGK